MSVKLGVVMDPIQQINVKKDTTFAFLLEAQRRGWVIFYMEQSDLDIADGTAYARTRLIKVQDDPHHWFDIIDTKDIALHELDVILMRKDPPFDMEYIYTTYLLEHAEERGTLIVNAPKSLRDANEKLFAEWFPQCTPKSLVTRNAKRLREFIKEHHDVVLKPLHTMGGGSIFRLRENDFNIAVTIEVLTHQGNSFIMAQQFIPEIKEGDKRIILIDGEPIPYALARIPAPGEIRGNLVAGAKGVGVELSDHDYWICEQIAPTLREKGLMFVGIDVIGDYLTEINVTSPTCVRELDSIYNLNISAILFDRIEEKLSSRCHSREGGNP